jgi:LCP family protein required for cell wall assembly
MKKIIAFAVFVLFIILAAKAVIWGVQFIRGSTLNSSDGRTNILILGIGGGTHEGADLTDTIMVLSLDSSKKSVALISIPRDIWSDTLKDKVNSAYHYGEMKQKGGGLLLSKVIMEDVIGMPIDYAVVIDFSGFTKVIDAVGGIDVNVPEAFTDTQYPKPGMEQATCPGDPTNACVYETVHFDAGLQHMDGSRALIYARSRHAEGDEGSDFARSRRQQIIMVALKDRFTHPMQWATLSRLQALPKLLDDATDMDMTIAQALTVGKHFASTNQDQIKKIVFDQLLDTPPAYLYNNLYVLVPHTSWDDVHAYIKTQL